MREASDFTQTAAIRLHTLTKIVAESGTLAQGHGARTSVVRSLYKAGNDVRETLSAIREISSVLSSVEALANSETLRWEEFSAALTSEADFLDDLHFLLREINRPAGILFGPRQQLRLKRSEARLSGFHSNLLKFQGELQWPLNNILMWQTQTQDTEESNFHNVTEYLDRVRQAFPEGTNSYSRFLDIMKQFKTGAIDTCQVITNMVALLGDRRELIDGFSLFLPKGYRIEAAGATSGAIQILTPNGIELYSGSQDLLVNGESGSDEKSVHQGDSVVEFNTAINFVNQVEKRYKDEPEIYRTFLEVLQTYQKESLPISEVHEEIATLFQSAPDLLEGFETFIPRTGAENGPLIHFSYKQLDFSNFETRFLSLATPFGDEDTVQCNLTHRSLINPPNYTALSYCWGDKTLTASILLNGHHHIVTSNLEAALRRLRSDNCAVVWADALCINQGDNYERSYQVSRMSSIYSLASKVIAWLGPSTDDSSQAMRVLSALGRSPNDIEATKAVFQHIVAIRRLLQRPYWQRLWIVQEIAKASELEVWCGDESSSWDHFIAGVNALSLGTPATQTLQHFCEQELASRRGVPRMLLSMALIKTFYAHATDQRDKIYALLGLSRDGSEVAPVPNYVQDTMSVFDDVYRRMIVTQGQTFLILLAGRRQPFGNVPSWLPVLSSQDTSTYPHWLKNGIIHQTSVPPQLKLDGDVLIVSALEMHELQASECVEVSDLALPKQDLKKIDSPTMTLPTENEVIEADQTDEDLDGPDSYIRSWTPDEVLKWMYETSATSATVEAFQKHNIDGTALLALSFSSLFELGIVAHHQRVELWRAIKLLRGKEHTGAPQDPNLHETREARRSLFLFLNVLWTCKDPNGNKETYESEDIYDLLSFWSIPGLHPELWRLRGLSCRGRYLLGDLAVSFENIGQSIHSSSGITFADRKAQLANGHPARNILMFLEDAMVEIELHNMKFVRSAGQRPYIVPQEACEGDRIFKIQNCGLRVLLRPIENNRYRVIGEVVNKRKGKKLKTFTQSNRDQTEWRDIMLI